MTGLGALRWAAPTKVSLSGRGEFGCSDPQQPVASRVLVWPSSWVGVKLVRGRACHYLNTFIMFFNPLLCRLLEEFEEERQENMFELRNTSWRRSSQELFVLHFVIVWQKGKKNRVYF